MTRNWSIFLVDFWKKKCLTIWPRGTLLKLEVTFLDTLAYDFTFTLHLKTDTLLEGLFFVENWRKLTRRICYHSTPGLFFEECWDHFLTLFMTVLWKILPRLRLFCLSRGNISVGLFPSEIFLNFLIKDSDFFLVWIRELSPHLSLK